MKKLMALLLSAVMLVSLAACSGGDNGDAGNLDDYKQEDIKNTSEKKGDDTFHFEAIDSESVVITGFESTNDVAHAVKIPAVLDQKLVIGIEQEAFAYKSNIKELTFATIEEYKAADPSLDEATFKFHINKAAFRECPMLQSVTLPSYVTALEELAFYGCDSLTALNIAADIKIDEIKYATFMECTALTSVSIPATVLTLGKAAFYGCSSLTSVKINEGTALIETEAFHNCVALSEVELPASLLSIGSWAFHGSNALFEGGIVYTGESEEVLQYIDDLNLRPQA